MLYNAAGGMLQARSFPQYVHATGVLKFYHLGKVTPARRQQSSGNSTVCASRDAQTQSGLELRSSWAGSQMQDWVRGSCCPGRRCWERRCPEARRGDAPALALASLHGSPAHWLACDHRCLAVCTRLLAYASLLPELVAQ